MNSMAGVLVIAAAACVTFLIRSVPFMASKWLLRQDWVRGLGEFLPLAAMTILTLHCAMNSAAEYSGGGLPEAGALLVTLILQWLKRDSLLSILVGGALYVITRNF